MRTTQKFSSNFKKTKNNNKKQHQQTVSIPHYFKNNKMIFAEIYFYLESN